MQVWCTSYTLYSLFTINLMNIGTLILFLEIEGGVYIVGIPTLLPNVHSHNLSLEEKNNHYCNYFLSDQRAKWRILTHQGGYSARLGITATGWTYSTNKILSPLLFTTFDTYCQLYQFGPILSLLGLVRFLPSTLFIHIVYFACISDSLLLEEGWYSIHDHVYSLVVLAYYVGKSIV